jgi:hypothetical protein
MERHNSQNASLVPPIQCREIAAALDPLFQRSHSFAFCAAVNHIRDVTMSHPLI